MGIIVRNIFKGERFMFASHINEFLVDRNEAKNSEVFLVEIPPKSKTHLHSHDKFEQTFFVLDGEGIITTEVKGEEIKVYKNDIIFLPLNQHHCIHNMLPDKSLKYLCVNSFNIEPLEKSSKSHSNKVINDFKMKSLDKNKITNTPIIVAGANGFLGNNVVKGLLQLGIPVVGIDQHFDTESNNFLYQQIIADLENEKELFNALNSYINSNPFPRYLICASGNVLSGKHAFNSSSTDFINQYNANVISTFNISKLYSKLASNRNISGGILFLGSIGAEKSHREHIAYDTSKGALISLCRSMALDLAPYKITVNTVSIGPIETSPTSTRDGKKANALRALVPLQRYAKIEEIVDFILNFALNNNMFLTGQNINLDGGLTIQLRPIDTERLQNPNLYNI